jgi:hypothetical protein
MMDEFQGRRLNVRTMMYEYRDGSGDQIPCEVAEQALVQADDTTGSFLRAYGIILDYRERCAAERAQAKKGEE